MFLDHLCACLRRDGTALRDLLLRWYCLVGGHNFYLLHHVCLPHHQLSHAVSEHVVERSRGKDKGKCHPADKQRKTVSEPVLVRFLLDYCDGLLHGNLNCIVEEGEGLREVVNHILFGD